MLLMDGVKYELWVPPSEDVFEQLVKEHTTDIFGENSIYLDTKQKLKSKAGIVTIPDGYAIVLGNNFCWHIVEVELSSHSIYDHVVTQVSKFINGIKNHSTQKEIVNLIYGIIDGDDYLKLKVRKAIEPAETYKFVSELISKPPELTVIIEQNIGELDEALRCLTISRFNVVEFKTFTRQGIGLSVHAHLFEPLYKPEIVHIKPSEQPTIQPANTFEITVQPAYIKYRYIQIPKTQSASFPSSNATIELITDIDTTNASFWNDKWGLGIRGSGLTKWYKAHPELKPGDKVIFEVIEPMKKYRLRKV
jgi:hypothetical protein